MEQARLAAAEDLPALSRLWDSALASLDGQRGGSLLADTIVGTGNPADLLRRSLVDADQVVLLGLLDTVAVGFASARCDLSGHRRLGVVDAIFVEPPARQVGVGEVLLVRVVEWCAERGCEGVDAPALPGSRDTKAFFEDMGFVTRLLVMHHRLAGVPGRV
ncbi:MAG: GNAT family N-acetyltransferase [Acidimicrobiales bacterium]